VESTISLACRAHGLLLGICIGCIVAKTNIHVCVSWNQWSNMCLGLSVRCWIRCSNIRAWFSVPGFMPICTHALYCLRKQYFLILLTKQRAYLYRISCWILLKLLLYFRKYLKLFWTILKMFRHFTTFHICYWFLFCRLAEPICFVLKPNKNI